MISVTGPKFLIAHFQENGHSAPELEAEIIQLCFKIMKLNKPKIYKTIVNNDLHRKCEKAGIRKTHIDKVKKEELKKSREQQEQLSEIIEKDMDKLVDKASVEQPIPNNEIVSFLSSATNFSKDITTYDYENTALNEDTNSDLEGRPATIVKTESLDEVKQEKQLTSPFKNLEIKKENDASIIANSGPLAKEQIKIVKPNSPQKPPPQKQKQKLSVKDYQRREAEEVQIVGVRQGLVSRQRQVRVLHETFSRASDNFFLCVGWGGGRFCGYFISKKIPNSLVSFWCLCSGWSDRYPCVVDN